MSSRSARIRKLLYSEPGKIILSIILAIGLASVFRKSCNTEDCIVRKVPSRYDIQNTVYREGGKCHSVKLKETECKGGTEYLIE